MVTTIFIIFNGIRFELVEKSRLSLASFYSLSFFKLPALLGNYDKSPTNRPTARPTNRPTKQQTDWKRGSFGSFTSNLYQVGAKDKQVGKARGKIKEGERKEGIEIEMVGRKGGLIFFPMILQTRKSSHFYFLRPFSICSPSFPFFSLHLTSLVHYLNFSHQLLGIIPPLHTTYPR